MRFAQPLWLWGLLTLPIFYLWIFQDVRQRKMTLSKLIDRDLWKELLPDLDWSARLRKGVFWTLALAFILIALARPQWGKREETVKITGLDILIALDLSNSMEVEDVIPSRLKRAKRVLRQLAERAKGDRIGIIGFAGSSFVASPLTNDIDYINQVVEMLSPRMIARQGTDIGLALQTASEAMERGSQESGTPEGTAAEGGGPVSKVLLLISDGEDLGGRIDSGLKQLEKQGARLYVFGVGTEKGGQIPVRDEDGNLRGYKRQGSEFVVSRFRPDALRKLASQARGEYFELTDRESDLEPLFQDLGKMARYEIGERKYVIYNERFQIPVALALICLLIELSISLRVRRLASAALLLIFSQNASAASHPSAYLDNQEGITALEKGRTEEALEKFGSAQASDPQSAELKYNLGITHAAREDWDASLKSLEEARDAFSKTKDSASGAQAEYNLGSTLEKKKQVPDAVRAYRRAIEQAQLAKDEKTELDARKRIEMLIQQQKQQQSQSGEQNQDPKQSQNEQNKEGDQSQDPKQPKQFQSPKKSFKSEKLSKEAADRVMNELQNQEKQIQGRMKKQKGGEGESGQDW